MSNKVQHLEIPQSISAGLAPEIILHILSFLHNHDSPSTLWPILTLCKRWASLAIKLIYEQPVVHVSRLDTFIATLSLQDRLQDGQTPIWDANIFSIGGSLSGSQTKNLGIEYRALIKKPCRIVGQSAPVKQDLIQLWDLQSLLWSAPAFLRADSPLSGSLDTSVVDGSWTHSQPSPPSSPSPPSPSSPTSSSSGHFPDLTSPVQSPQPQGPNASEVSIPASAPIVTRSPSSPKSPKAVLVRRKKKTLPPPGPVVLLLDVQPIFSDAMHSILREVPGMRLRRLQYKWILNVPLLELLEANVSTLQELVFSRPPIRQDGLMAVALLLAKAKQLHTLKLDHCQFAGCTVLTQFAHSCGSTLRTLEIRQHIMMRPMANHALFPVDGSEDYRLNVMPTLPDQELASWSSAMDACLHCGAAVSDRPAGEIESLIDNLGVSDEEADEASAAGGANVPAVATPQPQLEPPAEAQLAMIDIEAKNDFALKEFGDNCTQLSRLRLQHLTWLTDECLAGFRPTILLSQPPYEEHRVTRGLKEIEVTDSYYGSQRGTSENDEAGQVGQICRLEALVLTEHWVSINTLKEALHRWRRTLKVLSVRLFKCSLKELEDALLTQGEDGKAAAPAHAGLVLERAVLDLQWINIEGSEVEGLARRLFEGCKTLGSVEINKRVWKRDT
ncbi:hypothetical protein BGZ98_010255 [Dissophora globulifera]|nr:hypothetical protein BGZ98_010255 [Dissophora globulifera]